MGFVPFIGDVFPITAAGLLDVPRPVILVMTPRIMVAELGDLLRQIELHRDFEDIVDLERFTVRLFLCVIVNYV